MDIAIFSNILSSTSLVLLIAYLLTRLSFVKRFIATDKPSCRTQLLLALLFGCIGILSTYTGVQVRGAIANTRIIGVMAGGILGGPFVGIGAGILAGLHRYYIDPHGFTSFACCISTVFGGCIAGYLSAFLRKKRNNTYLVFLATFLAEIVQMAIILIFARPLGQAWELVKVIFIPMAFLNPIGVSFFIRIFDSVFQEQDRAAGERVRSVLSIVDQCLPYLKNGLQNTADLRKAVELIHQSSAAYAVMLTDTTHILAASGELLEGVCQNKTLPHIVSLALQDGLPHTEMEPYSPDDPLAFCYGHRVAVAAPLTQPDGQVIGSLLLLLPRYQRTLEVDFGFVKGLAQLFSTQLALAKMDEQKKLLERAEYIALQSQINPHFFFNALSTITAFCREKPERARELLVVLATYFRNTLNTPDDSVPLSKEFEYVNCYLELEKARFEERLQIEIDVPDTLLPILVPPFILQPIVENAVKHGAMRSGRPYGFVRITARQLGNVVYLTVRDNGNGISPALIERLNHHQIPSQSVGLSNVQKRLQNLYGTEYGLRIRSNAMGTRVVIPIPQNLEHTEVSHENCGD